MGILERFTRLFNLTQSDEKDTRLTLQGGDWGRYSGSAMNVDKALQVSAFWACVNKTAQAISSMPLHVFEKQADGGRKRSDSDIARIITKSPNADQTALEFWEGMVAWQLVKGNAYAIIHRIGNRVISLETLRADCVTPFRDASNSLKFEYRYKNETQIYDRKDIFHLKGLSFGGDEGLSVVRHGANSILGAYDTEKSAREVFANSLKISGVLSTDQSLDKQQRKDLVEWIDEYASNGENAGKILPVPVEMSFKQISMNPEDAQMLETRKFNIEEICRWFGIPSIVIGHSADGQTMWGSGVQQIMLAWLSTGLNPQLKRIETRIAKQLLTNPNEYAEFNRESLLQMDSDAKANFISTMVTSGVMTPDEGRRVLNMEKISGGEKLYMQGAMMPIEQIGAINEK